VEQVGGAEALLLTVEEARTRWDDLAAAEAIIFGAPTYMGSASAGFMAFQEATSHAVLTTGFAWKDKIAAGFTNSGSRSGDKLATLMQIALFAAQHGMHWVSLGLPPANNSTAGSEEELNRLGFFLGAGARNRISIRDRTWRHPKRISPPRAIWDSASRRRPFSSSAAASSNA
jgi:multimeric flavodoxin WrbA